MFTLENKLKALFQDLNSYLNKNKLASRIELRLKIKDLIETYSFSESEKRECEELLVTKSFSYF